MDGQRFFVENLTAIDRVVNAVAQRHRLTAEGRDELHSLVRLRLVENDYATLRAFEHRSSLATYLTVVITRIFLNERTRAWGRWRPSAEARRLGPVAMLMDRLITRDGYRLDEAITILQTNHRVEMSDNEIRRLWTSLPDRGQATVVPVDAALDVAAPNTAPIGVELRGRDSDRARVEAAVRLAMSRLTSRERLLMGLYFQHGLSFAAMAGRLGGSRGTIHRHVARILDGFREALGEKGLQWEDIRGLLTHGAHLLPDLFEPSGETNG